MFKKLQRTAVVVSITFIFVMFVAFLLSACSTSFPAPHNTIGHTFHKPVMADHSVPASPTPVAVPKQLTAKQLVNAIGCYKFQDHGSGADGLVKDSGSCYIHGAKYAIDTFSSKAARDAWLQIAKNYGVVPHWKTDTSVIYPSVG
jgi:hypothetical protein